MNKIKNGVSSLRSALASKTAKLSAGTGLAVAGSSAHADVTAVTGALTNVGIDVAVVGAAVLIVIVAVYGFKLLQKTL